MKLCPDLIKKELRRQEWLRELRCPSRCYAEAVDRSRKIWTQYELVNREFCPDDPVYSIINAGVTTSITADALTFQAASTGQGRILELILGGEATTSTVMRTAVQRAGTSITSNTAITPEKFNSRSPAVAGTYGKAGTQSLVGNAMLSLAWNAFGGFIRWVAGPGEEMYYVNSEVISMRGAAGVGVASYTGIFEEL